MDITQLKKVELEITSDCNAACPGCQRTSLNSDGKLTVTDFSLDDLKRMFPPNNYDGIEFKFCGVLGDPAIHPQFADMLQYILENNGRVSISTNGAIGTANTWRRIGQLCHDYEKQFFCHWCIDGHKETNHIYRVNTVWKVLERNMNAFVETCGGYTHRNLWVFIVFDHNEYEIDAAREHAERLGFKFATRTGMRNSFQDWVANIKKKDHKKKKVVTTQKVITTTGEKEHTKVEQVKELDKFIAKVDKTKEETSKVLHTIQCKYIHEGEIFIAADQTMWPCCFLSDSSSQNKDKINDKMREYGNGWNSLRDKSINEVMQHPWFDKILTDSWDPNHSKHLTRCIRTCAYNKAYHNELNIEETL